MIRKGISKQVISSVLAPTKIQKQAAFLNNIKLLAAKSEIAQRRNFSFSNALLTEKKDEVEDVVVDTVEESETEKLSREGIIEETEVVSGERETKEFQTETRQLLDIVATALYTDKEVFIRELISNASDALEKCRQLALTNPDMVEDAAKSLEINISVDEKNRTLTIQDSGIGMTKEELVRNIGTIAHSGSRAFMKQLREAGKSGDANNIIGQFGVGFYSVFMVTDKVRIYTRSCVPGSKGLAWESVGGSSYTLSEAEGVGRGTKIVLYLKETEKEFSMKDPVERIIKKYSNFVSFKISLNGARVNLLESIWLKSKDQVTPEQYKEFYKYISHYGGEPLYTLHFHTDVPLSIHGLFFVPKTHTEKLGMGKMDPGVNVYCKKVLIQAKHRDILPDWLRFVRGVVDSEDLPLNISREHLQDSPLIKRINGILTRKITKFFADMMKDDRKKYIEFHEEYNRFFKEGISSDFFHKDDLAKLLLFESNKTSETERVSLDEYVNRMKQDQQHIYYLIAPNKAAAEASPYFEVFKKKDYEVLFLYNPIDEFVMTSIASFKNKELRSIERAELEENKEEHTTGLSKEQVEDLSNWFRTHFPSKVESVTATNRLSDTPVIIKNPENAAMRMMRKIQGLSTDVGPQKLEINPSHPLITKLFQARQDQPELATLVGEQLFDNAMISAGLMEDPRSMLPRLMELLKTATKDVQTPSEKQ